MSMLLDAAARPTLTAAGYSFFEQIRKSPTAAKLLLAVYCGFLFFYGINSGPFYRTEALRAIVAREFLRSGNWVVPKLYGEPLLTKPPVHYAAIAIASLPGGQVTEWSARLPSALAACFTVFVFYCWFGRTLGQRAAILAGFIVPSSVMWFERAPSAEIDMVQLAWIVGSLYCFWRATEEDGQIGPTRLWWALALICVAGGVLTKWTAPLFFYGTVIPFLWRRGRLRVLFESAHMTGVAISALLVASWVGAVVWQVGWGRLYDTVCQEALPKFMPGQRDRGYLWGEIVLLPMRVFGGTLPWSAVALASLWPGFTTKLEHAAQASAAPGHLLALRARVSAAHPQLLPPRDRGERGEVVHLSLFFHCWLWPNLIFWSLAPNHAPRHSFPLAPAITALAALVLIQLPQLRVASFRCQTATLIGFVVAGILVAKIAFVEVIVPDRTQTRKPRETGQMLAQLVPPGATLYLFGVKDEGVMFYYDRPVCRLADPILLPPSDELLYCIITEKEWHQWRDLTKGEPLHELRDAQGALLFLVRMPPPLARIETKHSAPWQTVRYGNPFSTREWQSLERRRVDALAQGGRGNRLRLCLGRRRSVQPGTAQFGASIPHTQGRRGADPGRDLPRRRTAHAF